MEGLAQSSFEFAIGRLGIMAVESIGRGVMLAESGQ
jgi:hypothetical protein